MIFCFSILLLSTMKTIVSVLLITARLGSPSPLFQEIADFVTGVKYVPPTSGIFAPTNNPPTPVGCSPPAAVGYSPPVPAGFSTAPQRKESSPTVVFKDDGWLHSGETEQFYLLGEKDMNWDEARTWCTSNHGFLAEPSDSKENFALSNLLSRRKEGLDNFWIGLRRPFNRWETSRRLVTWGNWEVQERAAAENRCLILNGRNFKWENQDCSLNHGFRALCQKSGKQQEPVDGVIIEAKDTSDNKGIAKQCVVKGVSLDLTNWISRLENIETVAQCHNKCFNTPSCSFYSWSRTGRRCFLKEKDSIVVRDDGSESGTVLRSKGCNQPFYADRESRIETCSCEDEEVFSAGYLDPRSLPFNEGDDVYSEDKDHLGRILHRSACPNGKTLVCTDDDDFVESKTETLRNVRPNITDCLVNDVRLAAGKSFFTLYNVSNPETCHAHCLSTTGCNYWTWRGDLSNRVCFLLEEEGTMFRRAGSASGTVKEKYGCRLKVLLLTPQAAAVAELEKVEKREEECSCQVDDWTSLIDSRIKEDKPVGTGRIVNIETKVSSSTQCPPGYRIVCPDIKDFTPVSSGSYGSYTAPNPSLGGSYTVPSSSFQGSLSPNPQESLFAPLFARTASGSEILAEPSEPLEKDENDVSGLSLSTEHTQTSSSGSVNFPEE